MSRVIAEELLDTAADPEVWANLADLDRINRWLGGNRVLASRLRPFLAECPAATVLDVGSANGATVRWLQRRFPRARFLALDRSPRMLSGATSPAVAADVFAWPVADGSVDLVMCSLFLHHFSDEQVGEILRTFQRTARLGVLVVDLERHWLARAFLPVTRWLFGWHEVTLHDGPVSVDAALTAAELRRLLPRVQVRRHG